MGSGSLRTGFAIATIASLGGCSAADDGSSLGTEITGRVAGYSANGDALPLVGVRVVAREIDPAAGGSPTFHAAPEGDVAIGEAITDEHGRYRLDLPRGWVSLAFEHDDWLRSYRTENTAFDRALAIDVDLSPAPPPVEFTMPQEGDAEVVLDFDSPSGRRYARLRIEAGDLVTEDGSPMLGDVTARVDAPDPFERPDAALWAANFASTPSGVEPITPYGLIDVELSSGGQRVEVARSATLRWEIALRQEQLAAARDAWTAGVLGSYSLDTSSGLWVLDPAAIDFVDGAIVVERTHFSAGGIGEAPTTPAPCNGGYVESIIGLDSIDVGGNPTVTAGNSNADLGSNGNINVHGKAEVYGRAVSSAGSVSVVGNAQVTGGTLTGVPTFVAPIPEDDFTSVRATNSNAAIASSLSTTGALTLSSSQSVHLPEGDYALAEIDLSGKSQLTCSGLVRIYLAGGVKVAGQAKVNADSGCELVFLSDSTASISFAGGSNMGAIIFAPHADISFSGNGFSVYGSMVGRSVQIQGTFDYVATGDPIDASRVCEEFEPPPSADDDGGAGDDGNGDEGGSTSGDDGEDPADDDGGLPRLPDLPD